MDVILQKLQMIDYVYFYVYWDHEFLNSLRLHQLRLAMAYRGQRSWLHFFLPVFSGSNLYG